MEQQLRQRLVGAIVLVSLAVIFIPIILEGPGEEWSPRGNSIPRPPPVEFRDAAELPLAAADEPVVGEEAAVPEPVAAAAVVETPPAPVAAPVPEAPEAAPPKPAAPVRPAPVPPPPAAELANGWYAQVGSFSQQANAAGLRDRLVKAGYAAHLQQTDTGKGSSYRVLVGPEPARPDAERLLAKLVRDQQLKGIVIELPAAQG